MIERRSGKIVNIAGTSGLRGYPMRTAYSASKWAVRGITRTAALEVGEYNINVNAICPGIVETPRMEKLCREKAAARGWTYDRCIKSMFRTWPLSASPRYRTWPMPCCSCAARKAATSPAVAVDGGWDV